MTTVEETSFAEAHEVAEKYLDKPGALLVDVVNPAKVVYLHGPVGFPAQYGNVAYLLVFPQGPALDDIGENVGNEWESHRGDRVDGAGDVQQLKEDGQAEDLQTRFHLHKNLP